MEDIIFKFALQNAVRYGGKAQQGNVIPKVLGEDPSLKNDMKNLVQKIKQIVDKVNAMSLEEQTEKLKEIAPEMLEKKEKPKEELAPLEGVGPEGVTMRFAPSPSGPMHIGHAMTGGLTSLYVKKYGGKFILRIEDTNSDNIDPEAYHLLPSDGEWIFGNVTEVWVQSDRMQIYYDYALRFLKMGAVYVCTCPSEKFKELLDRSEACPCRGLSIEDNLARWEKMHDLQHGFKEGEAVVRFRSDLTINNPAMRDFPLIRINDSEHPRQGRKYRVWPLMNFAVFVDDVEAKMTHIIRGKDHADNAKRQEMMYKTLGLPVPRTYFLGRYNFTGLDLSCSKTKAKIKEGVFSGWDDIRLPFLGALRRRGYQPEAFLKYCQKNGISPVDKVVAAEDFFKSIDAFNKEIIDPIARRHFFIPDPIEVKIEGSPVIESELDLHPQNQKGGRKFTSHGGFILSKADVDSFKEGELIRLMDCINFRKKDGKLVYESTAFEDYKGKGHKILHWLPAGGGHAMTTVLMPDNTLISGIGERYIGELKVGDIVQFERFGFCRLDSVQAGVHNFWFAHK